MRRAAWRSSRGQGLMKLSWPGEARRSHVMGRPPQVAHAEPCASPLWRSLELHTRAEPDTQNQGGSFTRHRTVRSWESSTNEHLGTPCWSCRFFFFHFSFQSYQFSPMEFEALLLSAYTVSTVTSSWWSRLFIIIYCLSVSMTKFSTKVYFVQCYQSHSRLILFCIMMSVSRYSFFHSFTLNLCVSLYLQLASQRWHVVGSRPFHPTWQSLPFNWSG